MLHNAEKTAATAATENETLRCKRKLLCAAMSTLLRDTSDMIFIKDLNLHYIAATEAFAAITICSTSEELVGKTDFEIFDDSELAKRYVADDRAMLEAGEDPPAFIEPLPASDGHPRYASTTKHILRDENGEPIGVMGICRDVTLEYETRINYERELRYLFDLPSDVITAIMIDVTAWRINDIRSGEGNTYKIPHFESVGEYFTHTAQSVVDDEEIRSFIANFSKEEILALYESGKRGLSLEYLRRFDSGDEKWVRDELHLLIDPVTRHMAAVFILHDINDIRRQEYELKRAAESDLMTGLLNHETTFRRIEDFLANEGSTGTHAMFMIDIDDFKMVNDTLGHQKGDEVIIALASALRRVFRDSDIVGRIGGDEFLALMKNVERTEAVINKAHEVVRALNIECSNGEQTIQLSGSVGVSIYHGDGTSVERLYSAADVAAYRAKSTGKNCFMLASMIM